MLSVPQISFAYILEGSKVATIAEDPGDNSLLGSVPELLLLYQPVYIDRALKLRLITGF